MGWLNQTGTGAASGEDSGSGSSPGTTQQSGSTMDVTGTRTRGDLQRLVTGSANSLKVKTELMDTGDNNIKSRIDNSNYEYTDDDVFCLGDPLKKNSNTAGTSSHENYSQNFQVSGAAVLGHLGRGYNAVKAARRAASCLRQLNPNSVKNESVGHGSFTVSGDARVLRTKVVCNINSRIALTSSFDTDTGRCVTCAGSGHNALADTDGGPVAIVVADQAFPACLPVWRGGGSAFALSGWRTPPCAS